MGGLTWVGCLRGAMRGYAPLELHRVHDGNLGFLRLGCRGPPASPTSGIHYAGSNHNDHGRTVTQCLIINRASFLALADNA